MRIYHNQVIQSDYNLKINKKEYCCYKRSSTGTNGGVDKTIKNIKLLGYEKKIMELKVEAVEEL